jgi:hypothetical protein
MQKKHFRLNWARNRLKMKFKKEEKAEPPTQVLQDCEFWA